jgi:hypothetical protein
VRFTIRFFALLTLLGWFFATGHIALHHGGVANPGAHHALLGGGDDTDHDDDVPAQDGEHHHHDLAALADGRWMKSAEHKVLAPVWVPTFDALADRLVDRRCVRREPRLLPTSEHAPPDERAGGWLLDYQTALPVRGPSLTV